MINNKEICEVSEILIVQQTGFKFWVKKNRFGTDEKYISAANVEALLKTDVRVVVVSEAGDIIADNGKVNPYHDSCNKSEIRTLNDLVNNFEYEDTEEYKYYCENIHPHI